MTTDTFYGYITPPIDHALRVVVEERISELWGYRRWYRANHWAEWTDLRRENDAELRSLVRLARRARHIAATAYPDPIDAYKGWTESEARMLWGDR